MRSFHFHLDAFHALRWLVCWLEQEVWNLEKQLNKLPVPPEI